MIINKNVVKGDIKVHCKIIQLVADKKIRVQLLAPIIIHNKQQINISYTKAKSENVLKT
jgi:hypothetical protein